MGKWLIRIIGGLVLLVLVAAAFVWMVLAVPFFSDLRRGFVEDLLSEQIGQPLHVHDDVSIALGPVTHIYVGGVVIPSPAMDDTAIAELKLLEMELDVVELLQGNLQFDNLKVDGLQANLVTLEDGTTNWGADRRIGGVEDDASATEVAEGAAPPDADVAAGEQTDGSGILKFLSDKNASFTSIGLLVDDRLSGFEFVFDLETLELAHVGGDSGTTVAGVGSVNGQDFEIDGNYPHDAPFTTHANFGGMSIDFDGEPFPSADGGGFRGEFEMDTGSFGDFLDMIGLERVLEGSGRLSASLDVRDALKVETFSMLVELDEGQKLTAEGAIEDLWTVEGFELAVEARLFPEDAMPTAAKSIKDLKFTGLDMKATGTHRKFEFDKLLFRTNAFDQGLEIIGPASIESVRRMPDGRLAMLGIGLQAGPPEDPILQAEGEILDLLQLADVSFEGALKGAAKLLLVDMDEDFVDQFGGIDAQFAVDNTAGPLSLTRFDVTSFGTDLWTLDMSLAVQELQDLGGLDFDLAFEVVDGAQFLSALNLEPVDVGALGVDATTARRGEEFSASVGFAAGGSNMDAVLEAAFGDGAPVVRGEITSERLDLADLKNLTASLQQLQSLIGGAAKETDRDVQPLVLPKEDDAREVQPLVLPKESGKPTDLLDIETLLTEADVEVLIEFKEITGAKGVSTITSDLTARDGTVTFGPLDMNYGGGRFSLSASMDLVDSPEILSASGATSGWDLGEILEEVGLGIDAYGPLSGDFNVSGNISSVATFINSMRGNANLSMAKGAISTSLLELAGLGIFPWLFSEELRQGYTDITCIVAPVRLDAGRASFDSVVVETASVQIVAKGQVDWVNDGITVRAEPRRVGKPLARSAWPFDVTGQLSEPKFKLDIGGSRSRRADGADEMPAQRQPCVPDINQLQ